MTWVQKIAPSVTVEDIMLLQCDVSTELMLPITVIISAGLKTIWEGRLKHKKVNSVRLEAEILSRAAIMKENTKFVAAADIIYNAINHIST